MKQKKKNQAAAAPPVEEKSKVIIEGTDPEYTQWIEAYPLTERNLEVLQLIAEGCSNAAIAEKLYITVGTVETHVRNILNKLSHDDSADGPPPIPLPRRPGPKPGTFDAAELPPIDSESP